MPFKPGQSGNPGGRAKGVERIAREAMNSRAYTARTGETYTGAAALIHCLLDIAYDEEQIARDRIQAAKVAIERGYGHAKQHVEVSDGPQAGIDWTKVPAAERVDLLGAIAKLQTYVEEPETATEH